MAHRSLRLYEPLVDDEADATTTLRAVVASDVPASPPFAEARALERHRRVLVRALAAALDGAPLDASCADVERYVDRMVERATVDVRRLDTRDAGVGWTPLSLLWVVVCTANALLVLEYERRGADAPATFLARALRSAPVASRWLRAAGLVVVGGRRVARYTASELVSAVYVVRARLDVLPSVELALFEYVRALELRAALLVALVHSGAVHDTEQWRRAVVADDDNAAAPRDSGAAVARRAAAPPPPDPATTQYTASREFVAASAHWFVALRLALANYRLVTSPTYFAHGAPRDTPVRAYPVEPVRAGDAALERFERFIGAWAATYSDDAHADAWRSVAAKYCAAPGSIDAACAVRTDGERVQWRNALGAEHSSAAADYAASAKFDRRRVAAYIAELARRRRARTDARPTLGDESFFASLAVLHVWRVYVRSALGVAQWDEWFLVMARDTSAYLARLNAAVDAALPVIVQTLGRFSVLVPRPPAEYAPPPHARLDAALELERAALARVDAALDVPLADEYSAATLYETPNAMHALALWTAFLYEGWRGAMHRSATLAPLARYLLGIDDGGADGGAARDARFVPCDV